MTALICAWMRVAVADQDAFLDFHTHEHLPERLGVPGFLRGRRFLSLEKPDTLLVLYEVTSLAVLTTDAYVERLNNPSDWTKRSMPLIRESRRLALELDFNQGDGGAEFVGVAYLGAVERASREGVLAAAAFAKQRSSIIAARAGRVDLAASNLDTAEHKALGSKVETDGYVIVLEAPDTANVTGAFRELAPAHGVIPTLFQLQVSLSAD